MNKARSLMLIFVLMLCALAPAAAAQDTPEDKPRQITLYGPLKYEHSFKRASVNFKTGTYGRDEWDLIYGNGYFGEERDWFQVTGSTGARNAVRDLGALDWADSFVVPVVEPPPNLKEGEVRTVMVDTSGADGEDGTPAAPGSAPRRPKRDGSVKVSPDLIRAVAGHMYVLRVVNDGHDFYVLFRVESVVRGDNCTISWKRVPPPTE